MYTAKNHVQVPKSRFQFSILGVHAGFITSWEKKHVIMTLYILLTDLLILHRVTWFGAWNHSLTARCFVLATQLQKYFLKQNICVYCIYHNMVKRTYIIRLEWPICYSLSLSHFIALKNPYGSAVNYSLFSSWKWIIAIWL